MNKVYLGFAVADSMFIGDCIIIRTVVRPDDVAEALATGNVLVCANPSHKPTFDAIRQKYGIEIPVPDRAPVVQLAPGDELYVISVRGLPRLEGRHEYTAQEIEGAQFAFTKYTVKAD